MRQCFAECTAVDTPDFMWQQAQLSLSRGVLGLCHVPYHSSASYLASAVSSGLSYEVCRYLHYSVDLYNNLVDPRDSLTSDSIDNSCSTLTQKFLKCQTKLRIVSSRNYLITPLQSTGLIYYPFHHPIPQLGYQLLHPLARAFTWSLLNFRWR